MFGYTPGRDVHHFVSPTGGRLSLSGGEPVMRPEFGSVVGKGWVDAVNSAARTGGVSGVKRVLGLEQAHAKRGRIVFPVPGGYVERTAYNLGHDGMDINHANDASGNVPFLSATSGRVTTTGYSRGYGNAAFVASPFGELVYGHALDGSVRVSPGQSVKPGQWLANIGNSSGPHLHFGFPGGSFAAVEALLAGSLGGRKSSNAGSGFNPLAKFSAAISAVKDFAGKVPDWFTKLKKMGPWGDMLKKGVSGLGGKLRDWVNGKIPGPGPMPDVFDQGGLASGAGYLPKAIIKPERVLSPDQTAAFERQVATLESWDRASRILGATNPSGGGTQLQVTRFRIEDWEQGLAAMESTATAAAEQVLAAQDSHDARIHDLDIDYAGA